MAELEGRFDAMALVGKRADRTDRPEPAVLRWWASGDKHACLGLAWHLVAEIRRALLAAVRDRRPETKP